jgi:hypothetical protein
MTRRDKHASVDQLASLAAGGRPRRAARIRAHVAQCEQCTRVSQELKAIPAILAGVSYPPMPENLSARIESAISSDARQRLAMMPASEADRRDLPARRPHAAAGGGWHLPGLSVAATRLAVVVGAVVIAAGGSYLVAQNVGTSVTSSSSAAAGAAGPAQSLGPDVTYGKPGSVHTIRVVESDTNFAAPHLRAQAIYAVHASQARGASAAQPAASTAAPLINRAAGSTETAKRLAGCIGLIAPGRTVLLIDIARYQGKHAAVIVTAATAGREAEAWVVGSSCSSTTKDVLTQVALGHL